MARIEELRAAQAAATEGGAQASSSSSSSAAAGVHHGFQNMLNGVINQDHCLRTAVACVHALSGASRLLEGARTADGTIHKGKAAAAARRLGKAKDAVEAIVSDVVAMTTLLENLMVTYVTEDGGGAQEVGGTHGGPKARLSDRLRLGEMMRQFAMVRCTWISFDHPYLFSILLSLHAHAFAC